jgi:hypothetical protein
MELVLFGKRPLATAAFLGTHTGSGALVIDASKLTFACPLDLTGLLVYAHHIAESAIPVEFVVPQDDHAAAYIQRMDVLRHLPSGVSVRGRRLPTDVRTNRAHRLVEVTRVRGDEDDAAVKVGTMVTAHYADIDEGVGRAVTRACLELLSNAAEHGAGGAGAFLCAQTYTSNPQGECGPPTRRFEFAICDSGIGVKAHLRKNPKLDYLTDDVQALNAASLVGISGAGEDRGNGLFDLVDKTKKRGHIDLQLRSGFAELTVNGTFDDPTVRNPQPRPDWTPGTWAWLTFTMPEGAHYGSICTMKREQR